MWLSGYVVTLEAWSAEDRIPAWALFLPLFDTCTHIRSCNIENSLFFTNFFVNPSHINRTNRYHVRSSLILNSRVFKISCTQKFSAIHDLTSAKHIISWKQVGKSQWRSRQDVIIIWPSQNEFSNIFCGQPFFLQNFWKSAVCWKKGDGMEENF